MIELLQAFQFAAPVAFAATGETVNQRAGTLNVGIEGTMLLSAYIAMQGSSATGSPLLGLIYGLGAGVLLTLVAALFIILQGIDQVVVGTAVNLFSLGLTGALYRAQFGGSGQLISVAKFPPLLGLDPILWFLPLLIVLTTLILARTNWGLVVRACGEYPKAVVAAGFSVRKVRLQALLFGGLCAALGGCYLTLGITGSFSENCTVGRGFVALAMVTFGRWRPMYVFAATLFVGLVEAAQYSIQSESVPFQLVAALPYVLSLIVLTIAGKGAASPKDLGVPYIGEG